MIISRAEIDEMEKLKRINLINSITGIKPANLIGTISSSGHTNLAIFSSVLHLGSNPPLIGMISRPDATVPRHTLNNINAQGHYTINHLPITMARAGHYTSAKFPENISEFDECGFTAEFIEGHTVPFVKESPIKMLLKLKEQIPIKANGTIHIIGEILQLIIDDNLLTESGQLDLESAASAGVSGVDSYYSLTKEATFPYARVDDFKNDNS